MYAQKKAQTDHTQQFGGACGGLIFVFTFFPTVFWFCIFGGDVVVMCHMSLLMWCVCDDVSEWVIFRSYE